MLTFKTVYPILLMLNSNITVQLTYCLTVFDATKK